MIPVLVGQMAYQDTVNQLKERRRKHQVELQNLQVMLVHLSGQDRQLAYIAMLHHEGALLELGSLLYNEDHPGEAAGTPGETDSTPGGIPTEDGNPIEAWENEGGR